MTYIIKVRAHGKIEYHPIWAKDEARARIKFGTTPNETIIEVKGLND
jgi:hypothetical protein|tara:strand:- start:1010 stop:1150 length:141 start_codon:yes stop_codon:yes gene_type:complete